MIATTSSLDQPAYVRDCWSPWNGAVGCPRQRARSWRSSLPALSVTGRGDPAARVAASGRFHTPRFPAVVDTFTGALFHSFDYPGAEPLAGRSVLVYGNGISGVEIASDLGAHAPVISAFRKSRYVIQKVVDGVSSDWQWYSMFGALERRYLSSEEWAQRQRARVLRGARDAAD